MENGAKQIAHCHFRSSIFGFARREKRSALLFHLRPTKKKNARGSKKRLTLFFPTFTFGVQERR
jgi:hypothetical protein